MNFSIRDGDNDYLDKLPEFVKEYNNNDLNIEEIILKLDITMCEYRKLRRQGLEDGSITLRRKPNKPKESYKNNPKNYSHTLNGGHTYFTITKNNTYYTSCKTERQAKEIVRRLRACGWDKSKVDLIKESVCG